MEASSFWFIPRHLCLSFFFLVCLFFLCFVRSISQASAAKTDPNDARMVNTILGRWGKQASAKWNISGELCSGAAIDSTSFDDGDFNPAVKCDCSYVDGTVCHVTQFKVVYLDVDGTFPDELRNLTYLTNLNLRSNYLTGPFPAFIGNLTALQYLSVGTNAFSGPIPKELGKLTKLRSLSIGENIFSGPLPEELGNLASLEQCYLNSCGASGELPPSLSKLKSLNTLWASDNNFTGKIPDFIGSLTKLNTLYKSCSYA